MKSYPRIAIIDLSGDVLAEVTCIDAGEAEAFIDEVRGELAVLLGLTETVARVMIAIDVGSTSVAAPMPACFSLSAQTRRAFAREVAGLIRPHFHCAARDTSEAA